MAGNAVRLAVVIVHAHIWQNKAIAGRCKVAKRNTPFSVHEINALQRGRGEASRVNVRARCAGRDPRTPQAAFWQNKATAGWQNKPTARRPPHRDRRPAATPKKWQNETPHFLRMPSRA